MSEYRSGYNSSHALIVGINTYSDPRFMPLGQAESDAQSMAALLGSPPYNFTITQLLGTEATKNAILQALYGLRRTKADDRVLVYFAGHGYTLSDRLGNETGFLACADTVPEQDFTALKLEDVIDLTRHSEAKHIGFVFDACFSGQALGLTRAPSVTADKLMQRRAYQVISAGAGDQTVSDYSSMTGRIVEALQSGALMNDGLVTLGELGLHVQQSITADSYQTQIPQFGHIRGSQGGDFVFYVDTSVRLPAELEDVLRSNRATVRLSGVIELVDLANDADHELAQVARDRLASIVQNEPEERVREAAQSYFDELDAQREADEALREAERKAQEAHRRADAARQARNLTPPKMPKPQAAPEPEPEPEPAHTPEPEPTPVYRSQGVYSDTPVIEESAPPPAPAPMVAVSKSIEVTPPAAKAAPVFDREVVSARDDAAKAGKPSLPLPMPVLIGIGGILAVLIVAAIAMNALGGGDGDNENDNDSSTQVAAAGNDNQDEDEPEPTARKTNTPRPSRTNTPRPNPTNTPRPTDVPEFSISRETLTDMMPTLLELSLPSSLILDDAVFLTKDQWVNGLTDSAEAAYMENLLEDAGLILDYTLYYGPSDLCTTDERTTVTVYIEGFEDAEGAAKYGYSDSYYDTGQYTELSVTGVGTDPGMTYIEFDAEVCDGTHQRRQLALAFLYHNLVAGVTTNVETARYTLNQQKDWTIELGKVLEANIEDALD